MTTALELYTKRGVAQERKRIHESSRAGSFPEQRLVIEPIKSYVPPKRRSMWKWLIWPKKNDTTQTKCQLSISQKMYFFARVPQTHPHRLATILASQGTLALVKSWSLRTSCILSVRITITFGIGKMEKTLNIRLSGKFLLLDIYLYWEQCFCFNFFLCSIDLQKCNNCKYISKRELNLVIHPIREE